MTAVEPLVFTADSPATPTGRGGAEPPVMELTAITRTFPGNPPVEALKPTDLVIERGDYLSIVGPSGSGKSTLLHIMGLLDKPSTGTYRLDGLDTGRLGDAQRTGVRGRKIGFVFQSFHLLDHRTVLENVILAQIYNGVPRKERADRAREALEQVGLGHRIDFTPITLSGGEKQRCAIARALVSSPSILLADEPTGNLDSATSEQVLALFDDLHAQGLTLAVITHDLDVSRRARRVVRITDGILAEEPQSAPSDDAGDASAGGGDERDPRRGPTPSRGGR